MKLSPVPILAFLLTIIVRVGAQTDSSLTTVDSEISPQVAIERLNAETERLRKELTEAQERTAQAQAEVEVFHRQIEGIKLRMDALGVSTLGESSKLEQRLLQAVRDLQLAAKARKSLSEQMVKVADTASVFLKTQNDKTRALLEAALKKADEILVQVVAGETPLAKANEIPATLVNGKVSAVTQLKTKAGPLTCVVINLGEEHGVKVGMPFQIRRENRTIGIVRIIDVRLNFSGAVIQNLSHKKDNIQLGDNVRVNAQK